jgi:hypothetical protein
MADEKENEQEIDDTNDDPYGFHFGFFDDNIDYTQFN